MSDKKTKIVGLPPKIALNDKNAKQGNMSSESSRKKLSDGTLLKNTSCFDDSNTLKWEVEGGAKENIRMPLGLPDGSYTEHVHPNYAMMGIVVDGYPVKGVADGNLIELKKPLQEEDNPNPSILTMEEKSFIYKDDGNYAADAKGFPNDPNYEFYKTGTPVENVGEGFDGPVWAKEKIEIDISANASSFEMGVLPNWEVFKTVSTVEDSEFTYDPGFVSGSSYPMAYYNFDQKKWEGIGVGIPLNNNPQATMVDISFEGFLNISSDSYLDKTNDILKYQTIGFSPGIVNGGFIKTALEASDFTKIDGLDLDFGDIFESDFYIDKHIENKVVLYSVEYAEGSGRHITDLEFPYGARYHATGSQAFKMSNVIDAPFLVEKIDVEIEGAKYTLYDHFKLPAPYESNSLDVAFSPATMSNFFILRQRHGNSPVDVLSGTSKLMESDKNTTQLHPYGNDITVNTTRDLVTYARICGYTEDMPSGIANRRITESNYSFFKSLYEPTGTVPETLAIKDYISNNSDFSLFWKINFNSVLVDAPPETPVHYDEEINPKESWLKDTDFSFLINNNIQNSISGLSWENSINLKLSPGFSNRTGTESVLSDYFMSVVNDFFNNQLGGFGSIFGPLPAKMIEAYFFVKESFPKTWNMKTTLGGNFTKVPKNNELIEILMNNQAAILFIEEASELSFPVGLLGVANEALLPPLMLAGGSTNGGREGAGFLYPNSTLTKGIGSVYSPDKLGLLPLFFNIIIENIPDIIDPNIIESSLAIAYENRINSIYNDKVVAYSFDGSAAPLIGPAIRGFLDEDSSLPPLPMYWSALEKSNGQEFFESSPQVFYPEDELIIGWQQPVPLLSGQIAHRLEGVAPNENGIIPWSKMEFEGPAKITLYGSYVENGKQKEPSAHNSRSNIYVDKNRRIK
ncbi:MAG: hypothetical protein WDA29_08690 [Flavobacteriaceae bacterium]